MSETAPRITALESVLAQLTACAKVLVDAIRTDDGIAQHYGFEGTEFELVRAHWLLGEKAAAEGVHALMGDHMPDNCPVCVGESAYRERVVS